MHMVSAIVLTNILLASAAISAPSLKARLDGHQFNTSKYHDAPVERVSIQPTWNLAGALYHNAVFTAVSGIITVPTLTTYGAATAWVGIDGASCRASILRTGVRFVNLNNDGQVTFSAWWQLFPYTGDFPTDQIDFKPDDIVKLSVVSPTLNSGIATIENLTTKQVASKEILSNRTLCRQDAAWMVEVPHTLPTFGTFVFFDAVATTPNGDIGPNNDNVELVSLVQGSHLLISIVDSYSITLKNSAI